MPTCRSMQVTRWEEKHARANRNAVIAQANPFAERGVGNKLAEKSGPYLEPVLFGLFIADHDLRFVDNAVNPLNLD